MQELKDIEREILEVLASDKDGEQTDNMLMHANITDPEVKALLIQLNSASSKRYKFMLKQMARLARASETIAEEGGCMETEEKKSSFKLTTTGIYIVSAIGVIFIAFIMLFILTYINPDVTKTAIGHTRDLVSIIKDGTEHTKQLSQQSNNQSTQGGNTNVQ